MFQGVLGQLLLVGVGQDGTRVCRGGLSGLCVIAGPAGPLPLGREGIQHGVRQCTESPGVCTWGRGDVRVVTVVAREELLG